MKTTVQRAAMFFGWVFILVAALGFLASGGSMASDPGTAPRALGLFPVNVLHNLVHLVFGIWGLAAATSWRAAVTFTRTSGIIYLLLVPLAFVSPTTFGLMPIGAHDVWLHLVLGLGLVYFGFSARRPEELAATPEPRTPATAGRP